MHVSNYSSLHNLDVTQWQRHWLVSDGTAPRKHLDINMQYDIDVFPISGYKQEKGNESQFLSQLTITTFTSPCLKNTSKIIFVITLSNFHKL